MSDYKILKLTTDELIIGKIEEVVDNKIIVLNPFSIYTTEEGEAVMPYMFHKLMDPMDSVMIRDFDVMWVKDLSSFKLVQTQYMNATNPDYKEIIL